ncbi:MAG: hypothetical protein II817_05970 [Bacteroidales bacterium]|nr:hypothetical protein [Bacteroidales bacterium]
MRHQEVTVGRLFFGKKASIEIIEHPKGAVGHDLQEALGLIELVFEW